LSVASNASKEKESGNAAKCPRWQRICLHVASDGATSLEPENAGPHRYLVLNSQQQIRVLEALAQLASQLLHGTKELPNVELGSSFN
jgi:hypothetical protein